MLITNLMSRALARNSSEVDLRLLDLLANPPSACNVDTRPIPAGLRYMRQEHTELLVFYPNEYSRRYWWWVFWRASK